VMRMVEELKFFSDKSQQEPITEVDFKRVDVGETHQRTIYMANISPDWPIVNISRTLVDRQLAIDFPERLSPNEISSVRITWSPSLNRREPLDIKEVFDAELWIGP